MTVKKAIIAVFLLYLFTVFGFSFLYSQKDGNAIQTSPKPSESDVVTIETKDIYLYVGEKYALNKFVDNENISLKSDTANISNGIFTAESAGDFTVGAYDPTDSKHLMDLKLHVFEQNMHEKQEYKLNVYKGNQTVVVFDKDEDGEYTVPVKVMLCATGDEDSETISGEYNVKNNYRWRLLKGPSYGQYATSFSSSYLFHSMPYDTMSPDTIWDDSYQALGEKSSHGCIRLALIDSKWIYDHVAIGSPVSVLKSSSEYTAPPAVGCIEDEKYDGWDPTDIDENNPYKLDGLTPAPVAHLEESEKVLKTGDKYGIIVLGSADSYAFYSNNKDVASVNENGKVTAVGKGECTIYVIGSDGSDTRLSMTVK